MKTRVGKRKMVMRWVKLGMLTLMLGGIGFGVFGVVKFITSEDNVLAKEANEEQLSKEQTQYMNDGTTPDQIDGSNILEVMNQMCHQKVIANDKWGAVEMNKENIRKVQKAAKSEIGEERVTEILNDWAKGDFSHIVEDHNEILGMQGGTIGEATGTMTKEQEQQFIENNFR